MTCELLGINENWTDVDRLGSSWRSTRSTRSRESLASCAATLGCWRAALSLGPQRDASAASLKLARSGGMISSRYLINDPKFSEFGQTSCKMPAVTLKPQSFCVHPCCISIRCWRVATPWGQKPGSRSGFVSGLEWKIEKTNEKQKNNSLMAECWLYRDLHCT